MKTKESKVASAPTTMAELAERLGVSPSLVSKALAGDGKVAAGTRERIVAAAREMGYMRNTTASLLAKRRHSGRVQEGRLLLAHLTIQKEVELPELCAERGVMLEQVLIREEDDPKRVLEVLWNRGVSGILLPADQIRWRGPLEDLPWHRFSVLKLGRVHPELPFHLLRHEPFDFAMLALRRSCEVAKRRVCVVLWETASDIDNLARLGAVLAYRETQLPAGLELEWRNWESPLGQADPGVLAWLQERKPDTVLLFHYVMLYALEQAGLPDGFRARFHAIFYDPKFSFLKRHLAGCDASSHRYMGRALDLLLELIGRGERGFVQRPTEHVVEPEWAGGAT